jgi:hypothetical protein
MTDPEANSVRALAVKHHLSIKRIDAILRLKGLEESWKKVRNLFLQFVSFENVMSNINSISLIDIPMVKITHFPDSIFCSRLMFKVANLAVSQVNRNLSQQLFTDSVLEISTLNSGREYYLLPLSLHQGMM